MVTSVRPKQVEWIVNKRYMVCPVGILAYVGTQSVTKSLVLLREAVFLSASRQSVTAPYPASEKSAHTHIRFPIGQSEIIIPSGF